MSKLSADLRFLADEYRRLAGRLGRMRRRCRRLLTNKGVVIERLQGEVMRLRAEVIARDSALAYAREDLSADARAAEIAQQRR